MTNINDSTQEPAPRVAVPALGNVWVHRSLLITGGLLLGTMTIYIVANALSRKLFNAPLPASLEIVQYWFMPALACLGFVVAQLRDQNVAADLLFGRFSLSGRKWLTVGTHLLGAITLLAMVYFTFSRALFALDKGIKAGYTSLPAWPVYFLVPLSLLIVAVLLLAGAGRAIRSPLAAFEHLDSDNLIDAVEEEHRHVKPPYSAVDTAATPVTRTEAMKR